MTVKLLTEHHLECLSLKGGCIGSSESTLVMLVKMPHCWKPRVAAHIFVEVKEGGLSDFCTSSHFSRCCLSVMIRFVITKNALFS